MSCTLSTSLIKRFVGTTSVRCFNLSPYYAKKRPLKPPPKNFMKFPVKGSVQYVARQLTDPYVKRRHVEGYRCRSIYKLKEMHDKHHIFKSGITVVDIGAAPGSWSQAAVEEIFDYEDDGYRKNSSRGQVIAIDLIRFSPIDGVTQITGDITNKEIQVEVVKALKSSAGKADVIMCDAAPKASGHKNQDHMILVNLIRKLTSFALRILKPGGTYLFKMWDGTDTPKIQQALSQYFTTIKNVKPPASRDNSPEFYMLCEKFKGLT